MKLNNLKPAAGSTNLTKRVGRGQGSGRGGTSTRGTKGAKSRSGYSHKVGFEGGQMPLQRRLPKFGFKNPTRVEFRPVNLGDIQKLSDKIGTTVITLDTMVEAGLASSKELVKVLGFGTVSSKLEISADAFSKAAVSKIEAAGGKAIVTE